LSIEDPDSLKAEAKKRVHVLVEDYKDIIAKGKKDAYNEERVKIAFVLPLLEALGWNPRTDEVLPEQATLTGRADFGLRVGGRTKIFVEMKSFIKNLNGHDIVKGRPRSYSEQAIQYAWGMKADWAALTNFEETKLYDSHVNKPEDGLVWKKTLKFTEYESRFDELWLISKHSVVSGALDAYEAKTERPPVDKAFLDDLMNCRQLLAENIRKNNPSLSYDEVNESVQKILDRLIFIKNCEDRLIIPAESLWKRYQAWQETAIDRQIVVFMMDLKNFFRYFDQVFNGKLFEKHTCEDLKIDNEVLEEIINTLYGDGQHLGYNFSVIPVDVLGQAYELYIGSIIKEKEGQGKAIEIVKQPAKRKAYGIYYTPEPIVNYIVRSTLGKVLEECKSPEDVSRIKVLDPACGSGSFLIKAFDVIREWYESYNKANRPINAKGTLDAHFVPIPNVEERILTQNLFGVDLDPQAVEITILNLSLKAIRTKEKLPYMADHIKCGNSLIEDESIVGDKAFKWKKEFEEILENGGFDVICGNPPYVRVQQLKYEEIDFFKSHYTVAHERIDISLIFFELANRLVRKNGKVGFISSSQFMTAEYGRSLRRLLLEKRIEKFVDFGSLPVFEDAITYPAIVIFSNNTPEPFEYYKITKLDSSIIDNLPAVLTDGEQSITKLIIHPKTLNEGVWNFAAREEIEIIEKIRKVHDGTLLGSFANPSTGITTGSDEIMLVNQESISQNGLEREVLIKVLRGRNIEPWIIKGPFDYAIYPYRFEEGETKLVGYEELKQMYPNTHDYLLKNKNMLLSRKDSRKEVAENKKWYSLIRKGKLDVFRSVKIVTPALTKHNSFALDEDGSAFLTGGAGVFAIIQRDMDPRYLLAILNSKVIEFFLHAISTKKQGGYYSYLHTFLAQIPVVKLSKEQQQPFVKNVVQISLKSTEFHAKLNKLHNRLQEKYPSMSISKKLEKFYEMSFSAFLQETQKTGNVRLPLKEVDEWEEYFKTRKDEIVRLLEEISEISKQLDLLVFHLYELTEQEQSVVIRKLLSE
jgi:type I restriction-modification system DNA methylase subunit